MKYSYVHKDLFTVDTDYVLAHCISSDFVMGGGIALLFTRRGVKQKLLNTYPQKWSGRGYCLPIAMDNYMVANLVTKEKVYHKPTYDTLIDSLLSLKAWMFEAYYSGKIPELKIAMPLIGCGLDGLSWSKVEPIIKEVFENTGVEILVCEWS